MTTILKNGHVYTQEGFLRADISVSEKGITVFDGPSGTYPVTGEIVDCKDALIIPGLTDVHVHFREPGFSYKETIATGTAAAVRGGYTNVCTMPNLKPAPSTLDGLKIQLDAIRRDAKCRVFPYGAITLEQSGRGALSDMEALAPYVCAFTDDGVGVQAGGLMREAMEKAKSLGKLIVAHCEDNSLLGGTAIHDGLYAKSIGHRGITSESEWRQIERDVKLADETGCAYHVCHVSTKESVAVIRDAKKSGVDVTCETGPHYLTMCDSDFYAIDPDAPESGRFKMNPPIRGAADRDALIEGIIDGTVDMIATDHAPHSIEEKTKGLLGSANGIVGLETAFPVLYTELVRGGIITIEKLVYIMAIAPRLRFGLPGDILTAGRMPDHMGERDAEPEGALNPLSCDLAVIDISSPYAIDPSEFAGKGRSTPFDGWEVYGRTMMTIMDGKTVYRA
ncbi:MAG: dihydroorotase [Eubacterium sp.]|nr:dihydroorotase [Eubacterium sp.]